mmetsp:Transcript_24653/g.36520  ORF Transcript_24653/g.36520 Transcript_24653/m.36520 type:complete len:92 (-) Transcript_24653:461-736(-)
MSWFIPWYLRSSAELARGKVLIEWYSFFHAFFHRSQQAHLQISRFCAVILPCTAFIARGNGKCFFLQGLFSLLLEPLFSYTFAILYEIRAI